MNDIKIGRRVFLGGRFPVSPHWKGQPPDNAPVEAYRLFQQRIGTSRVVIVNPSTYGTGAIRLSSLRACLPDCPLGSSSIIWAGFLSRPV